MQTITFGKYKGQTLEQIAAIDPSYLQWMSTTRIIRDGVNFSKLAEKYLDEHEDDFLMEVCPICRNTSCDGPQNHQPDWRQRRGQ